MLVNAQVVPYRSRSRPGCMGAPAAWPWQLAQQICAATHHPAVWARCSRDLPGACCAAWSSPPAAWTHSGTHRDRCGEQSFDSDWVFALAPRGMAYAWGGGGDKPLNTFPRSHRMALTKDAPPVITYKSTKFDVKLLGIKAEWLEMSDDEGGTKDASDEDGIGSASTEGGSSVSSVSDSDDGGGTSAAPTSLMYSTSRPSTTVAGRGQPGPRATSQALGPSVLASTHAPSSMAADSIDALSMLARKRRKQRERDVESAEAHARRKERKRLRKKRRLRKAREALEAKAARKVIYRLADVPQGLTNDELAEECVRAVSLARPPPVASSLLCRVFVRCRYERMGIYWSRPVRVNLGTIPGSRTITSLSLGQKHAVMTTDERTHDVAAPR